MYKSAVTVRVVPDALLAPNVTLTMRKPKVGLGANTHATLTRFVVAVAVPLRVPAPRIRPPGGPVVSISTYVELPKSESPEAGEGDEDSAGADEGVPDRVLEEEEPPDAVLLPLAAPPVEDTLAVRERDGVPLPLGVPDGVLLGEEPEEPERLALRVREGVPLGVAEVVPDRVLEEEEPPDAVLLPLAAPPVGDPLAVREPLGVLELERVPDRVREGVNVGDGVRDDEAPPDIEAVAEGVCEGVGSITPTT